MIQPDPLRRLDLGIFGTTSAYAWLPAGLLVCLLFVAPSPGVFALDPDEPEADRPAASRTETAAFIEQQIRSLSDASYRQRQLARWRLEQQPEATIRAIDRLILEVDYNTASQLIDLLSMFATHNDVEISLQARAALAEYAKRVSAVGRLAQSSMQAIAEFQESQAIEVLRHHRAIIGPRKFRLGQPRVIVNGMLPSYEFALHVNENFSGDDEEIQWIQFLKGIETVYLEGPRIDSRFFRAISQLRQLKNVKIRKARVTLEDLSLLRNVDDLEHLEFSYVDIDDSAVEVLASLPISQNLRLYGTRITQAGAARLARQLDGIDIYCGSGGFLGVATSLSNTKVNEVVKLSGAEKAGIKRDDVLTHINDVAIENFEDLRTQLGLYVPGETIQVRLRRPLGLPSGKAPPGTPDDEPLEEEFTLAVVLGEEPNR